MATTHLDKDEFEETIAEMKDTLQTLGKINVDEFVPDDKAITDELEELSNSIEQLEKLAKASPEAGDSLAYWARELDSEYSWVKSRADYGKIIGTPYDKIFEVLEEVLCHLRYDGIL